MNTNEILSALDSEISRLTQVRRLLLEVGETAARTGHLPSRRSDRTDASNVAPKRGPGRPKGSTNKATSFNPAEFAPKRGTMSAEGRLRIAAAQRARWAKRKDESAAAAKPAGKSTAAKKAGKSKAASAKKAATTSAPTMRKKAGRPKKSTGMSTPSKKAVTKSAPRKSTAKRAGNSPVAGSAPTPEAVASA